MNEERFSTRHFTSSTASQPPSSDQDQLQADDGSPTRAADGRALVLGGGGSTGNAWLIGVVAGLVDAGLDVTDADLIVGTSAGATAAAQITSASTAQLFAEALVAPPQRPTGAIASGGDAARRMV